MSLDDALFARLATRARLMTAEQVSSCVEAQAAAADELGHRPRLCDVALQRGDLGRAQLQAIVEGVDRKTRRLFGEIAVRWHLITAEQLADGLEQQALLRAEAGKIPRIGALLMTTGILKRHQVKAVLAEQGKSMARCPGCGARFNVRAAARGRRFRCTACGRPLVVQRKRSREPVDADATLMPVHDPPGPRRKRFQFGTYEVLEELGVDGPSRTYRATRDGRPVVLTILEPAACEDEATIDQLSRRLGRARPILHDNLRPVLSFGMVQGTYYIESDYVEGRSLRQIVLRHGPLEPEQVLAIGVGVADALAACHARGLLHGDVRPSAVLVTPDGGVRLTGLGAVPALERRVDEIVAIDRLAPLYQAPEQLLEQTAVDLRSDVHGLAATLYHAATGKPPFECQTPTELLLRFSADSYAPAHRINPRVPPELSLILQRGLAAEADQRYPTIAALLDHLEHPDRALGPGVSDESAPPLIVDMAPRALRAAPGAVRAPIAVDAELPQAIETPALPEASSSDDDDGGPLPPPVPAGPPSTRDRAVHLEALLDSPPHGATPWWLWLIVAAAVLALAAWLLLARPWQTTTRGPSPSPAFCREFPESSTPTPRIRSRPGPRRGSTGHPCSRPGIDLCSSYRCA